jgi:hypothetical protein
MKLRAACVVVGLLSLALSVFTQNMFAQSPSSASASAQVPPLIQFSSIATDEGGNSMSGAVSITFSLYTAQQGGEPLWTETQKTVALDSTGHYSVQLGITQPNGVPTTLFTTGEARWLGVRIAEQADQPRVLLLSVPYALKAGDAATIGGLPPSAFVLAASATGSSSSTPTTFAETASLADAPPAGSVTGAGTVDFIPLWTTTSNIGNSALFQSGSGATAKVGINTKTPGATLDVKGAVNVEGLFTLPATGPATSSGGRVSQGQEFVASSYNSGTAAAVNQTFELRAEPVGNDTASPSGTLSLLFGSGTTSPAETGLKIASNGLFTFATGQTFPGAGTITGVTTATGSGLTGGGTSGTLNLGLKTCSANQVLQFVSGAWTCSNAGTGTITGVTAGTDLTGGGTGGTVTLSLDTTKVPQLGTANTFTGNQSVTGNITATGTLGVGTAPTMIGNVPSCGNTFGGIGFGATSLADCTHYSLLGEGVNTYLNRPVGGSIFFREANNSLPEMIIASGGNVGIGIANPTYTLHVGTSTIEKGFRVEGPLFGGSGTVAASFGGNGDFAIDAPGIVAGRFVVKDTTGNVGINSSNPTGATLVVASSSDSNAGISATGGSPPSGSGLNGSAGIESTGGDGDLTFGNAYGGPGGTFTGAVGFTGYGDGIDATNFGGGTYGNTFAFAGNFTGDINVTGAIFAGTKDFKIDHPLDPANKYLFHSSVESSEMMNIYTGNIITDSRGQATVQLPEWFEVLNTDFRYQLTVIGQFAQAIVGRKIEDNQFEIRTSAPNVEVSWQVTGLRQDAYAKAHPLVVEQEKEARLRGFYVHPELYGAPAEKQIEWARHPQMMKKIKEMQAKQLAAAQKQTAPRN